MSQLTKLVEFLDRDDVTEVVVATGRPVTLRMGGEYRALGRAPATLAQVDALFAGSPLAALVASGGGAADRMRLSERDCAVEVQVHGDQLLIRLTRARAPMSDPSSSARMRAANSSGPIVVAAPPVPRTRSRDHLVGPALAQAAVAAIAPRPVEAIGSGVFSGPARAADDDFGALLSRSDDGGPGPSATASREGTGGRASAVVAPTIGPRRKAITMPPIAIGTTPAIAPVVVDRTDVPVTGGGPAAARHSIELPPDDSGAAPVQVISTSAAPPPGRPKAAPPSGRAAPAPAAIAAPVAALAVAATAPIAAPAVTPPGTPATGVPTTGYAPARRHTITAAPSIEPLPPLATGKARATPELLAILAGARGRNASDLHLTGDRSPMERSVRGLAPVGPPVSGADVEKMLGALLSPSQRALLDARGYVDAALDVEGAGRLRANISRFRGGVKGSFRLVANAPLTLEQLGLPRELARVTTYHQGLVVIAGPNGHGKTTTLAALVDLINSHKAHHILTIEDPVEIQHPRKKAVISQREVGNHTRSFAAALKASLREDPDVIVIGELRDRETVEIALTAAETGHLVMATMSTPSASKSLDRLIDMFPPDDQQQVRTSLAAALKFVVAQRLLPTADGTAVVAAVELLTGVLPLAALIRDNKLFQVASLQQRGRAFGMIRLDDSLAELVRTGRITEEVALRAADSKKDLAAVLRAPAAAAAPPAKAPRSGIFGVAKRPD